MRDNQVSNMRLMSYIPADTDPEDGIIFVDTGYPSRSTRGDGGAPSGFHPNRIDAFNVLLNEGRWYIVPDGRAATADDLRQLADVLDAIDIERAESQPQLPLD